MPTPIKVLFSKSTRIDLLSHKVQSLQVESCSLSKYLKLSGFYNNWQKSNWWLNGCHGYHTKAVSLILSFWRPQKIDLRATSPSLKLSEQSVHELVRGPLNSLPPPPPPLTTLWGAKSLDEEGLTSIFRVFFDISMPRLIKGWNYCAHHCCLFLYFMLF